MGSRLQYEKYGNVKLWFFYDSDGNPSGLRYQNGSETPKDYYFACNWRGDVTYIYDSNGNELAKYSYDAWGNMASVTDPLGNQITDENHIANVNPIRYRGYYFDSETGMYYLQSRYYDPQVKRFINGDSQLNTGSGFLGYNLFLYCGNNPVNATDPSGHSFAMLAGVGAYNLIKCIIATFLVAGITKAVYDISSVVIDKTATAVRDFVESRDNERNTKNQSVYVLTDPKDGDKVKYVGRTNNPKRRKREHDRDRNHKERKDYDMKVVATDLSVSDAKVAEQILISAYTLSCIENARREISVGNLSGFRSNVNSVVQLYGSVAEDELMNLMGR